MSNQLCFQCFREKGDYEVCPWCGSIEEDTKNQAYQLASGTILDGRYIIGKALGTGGFGITYKAYDTVLSITVAMKEFYPARLVNRGAEEEAVGVFSGEKEGEYQYFLNNFEKEAEYMAKFSKEKDIVNIYGYVEANKTAYIVMEYIDGVLLKDYLKEHGKLTVEEATDYIVAILEALEKVHYQGLVHKDISPDNIFIMGNHDIKLADFGSARMQGTKSGIKTEAIIKVGYAPPEQYQPNSSQGAFMDIYAVGAVFYEMLTGEKPQDAMDRKMEDVMRSPKECGIEIDSRLDNIVMKAMAVRPELRFQTVEQMKKAILKKQNVKLPEEELKKKKLIKRITGIASAATIAVLMAVLVLSQTVFSGKGKIDVSQIEKDTVSVWMKTSEEMDSKELKQAVLEDMKEKCPQLTVKISMIPEEQYEEKLQEAMEKKELPNVFCTDDLPEKKSAGEYCEELTPLMNTVEPSSYLFLENLEKGKIYELPTSFQAAVVYVNENKAKDIPGRYTIEEIHSDKIRYADEKDAYARFKEPKSRVNSIAGDLSAMDEVKAVTVDVIPPTDFSVVPVLKKERLIGCFEHCYGIDKNADENKKKAGMVVLTSLLNDRIQSLSYMDNNQGIPVNKAVYEDYREYKMTTYLSFLRDYEETDILIQEEKNMYEILREK